MKAFEYASPTTPELALKALDAPNVEALAGGTDLLGRIKDDVSSPDRVVYLKDIAGLAGIKEAATIQGGDAPKRGLVIGANTRLAEIVKHDGIAASYPALRQAALEVGTPQIRNMATLGGNLLQRPRCWYYRTGNGLLGMKDGKSLPRLGDNRYHAIFLTDGDALFTSPSSLAVPLIALGAKATILGKDGKRTVPVEGLYQVPSTGVSRELTVNPGELLLEVSIPAPKGKNASYEARQKQAHDWPLVLASVNLEFEGEKVSDARVVIYGVAPIPWRSKLAEQAIIGKPVNDETATFAARAAISGAKPLSKNGFKLPLTQTVVKRALLAAVGNRYWEA
jgi:xanthine dehydrogenase YagS FAD-binding subunit